MKNSQKILKVLADIIETGVLSSKDIKNELLVLNLKRQNY